MKKYLFAVFVLTTLGACSSAKEELGLVRQTPDEFTVLKRAPLALPPDYELRAPRVGGEETNAVSAQSEARRVILGSETAPSSSNASSGTQQFLEQTGASKANPNIRQALEKENAVLSTTNRTVAEKLLFWDKNNDGIISDAEKLNANDEAKRLNTQGIIAPTPGEARIIPAPAANSPSKK